MTNYYGLNMGGGEADVASSSSATTSKDVEIVVNTTNVASKEGLVLALKNLTNYILRLGYPL